MMIKIIYFKSNGTFYTSEVIPIEVENNKVCYEMTKRFDAGTFPGLCCNSWDGFAMVQNEGGTPMLFDFSNTK